LSLLIASPLFKSKLLIPLIDDLLALQKLTCHQQKGGEKHCKR